MYLHVFDYSNFLFPLLCNFWFLYIFFTLVLFFFFSWIFTNLWLRLTKRRDLLVKIHLRLLIPVDLVKQLLVQTVIFLSRPNGIRELLYGITYYVFDRVYYFSDPWGVIEILNFLSKSVLVWGLKKRVDPLYFYKSKS